ncbi:MAG: ArsB/NhaD family transporter [Candidatus Omnitrophota bacterium]
MNDLIIGTTIFIITLVAILLDKMHRMIVALVGAVAMLVFLAGRYSQKEAFAAIDFNTIFLLLGMMILVDILKKSGIFQYLAIKFAKLGKGEPSLLIILLPILTAIMAAFMDAVTAVLLIAPITFVIVDALGLHPVPFLLAEGMAANIGGTATLVGDPPNVMIGSAAGLSFMDFVTNVGPVTVIVLLAFAISIRYLFRKELFILSELKEMVLAFDEKKAILDVKLMRKGAIVMGLVIIAFIFHDKLHLEVATIAMGGAALMFLVARANPSEVLKSLDWPTLLFFMSFFIVVGGLEKVGTIALLANGTVKITKGNPTLMSMLMLWFSAFASSMVDNIPYTATMIPLVRTLTTTSIAPLWWALSLGTCLGGNGTLIGASSNIAIAGISEKEGYPITFKTFMKYGMPLMIQSMLICTAYIYLRYLM